MDIACSTITWNQFRSQPDSPYARPQGYDGAVIVETDRTRKATALESATQSRRYLREVVGV